MHRGKKKKKKPPPEFYNYSKILLERDSGDCTGLWHDTLITAVAAQIRDTLAIGLSRLNTLIVLWNIPKFAVAPAKRTG